MRLYPVFQTIAVGAVAFPLLACGGSESAAPEAETTTMTEAAAGHEHGWVVDTTASKVTFAGTAYGKPAEGVFNSFTADIILDPENPTEGSSIAATIDVASLSTGDSDQDGTLPSKNWFWVKEHPTATFTSTNINAGEAPDTYVADGTLSIRGVSQAVSLPFSLSITGGRAVAHGELVLDRQDYGVGQGAYAAPEDILPDVTVRVHIEAVKAQG